MTRFDKVVWGVAVAGTVLVTGRMLLRHHRGRRRGLSASVDDLRKGDYVTVPVDGGGRKRAIIIEDGSYSVRVSVDGRVRTYLRSALRPARGSTRLSSRKRALGKMPLPERRCDPGSVEELRRMAHETYRLAAQVRRDGDAARAARLEERASALSDKAEKNAYRCDYSGEAY